MIAKAEKEKEAKVKIGYRKLQFNNKNFIWKGEEGSKKRNGLVISEPVEIIAAYTTSFREPVSVVYERKQDNTAELKMTQKQQISEGEETKTLDIRKIKIDF